MDTTNTSKYKIFDMIAMSLIVFGGINWGLVGFFGFDIVAFLSGEMGFLSRLIYMLIGASAVYHVSSFKATQKRWECNTDLSEASPNPSS